MVAEVVLLRDGAPLVNDVPAMMRRVADQIEAGEHGEVEAGFFIIPVAGGYPKVFGWGCLEGDNHPIVQCELAKAFLMANVTERNS